jgi:hypothetical protein
VTGIYDKGYGPWSSPRTPPPTPPPGQQGPPDQQGGNVTVSGGGIIGISRLDPRVLLGDSGQTLALTAAGAQRLVDLRGETCPPRLAVPVDHFPIMDLEPNQDELIARAAAHVATLARSGVQVGLYCQAGISRTATVAIAYLLHGGATLDQATSLVTTVRPQASPAPELMRTLRRLATAHQRSG